MTQPAPATSLRERRRERTRDELIGTLLTIIAEDGVDTATIERMATRSGMARGTLYAHFPGGRDDLLRAAYARLTDELVARSRAAVSAASSWQDQLVALAREMIELAGDPRVGHFYNVSGPGLIATGPERGRGSGASVELVRGVLAEARADGELGQDVDEALTAALLVGALREAAIAVASGGTRDGGGADPARMLAAFARLVAGLAAGHEGRE